MRSKWLSVLVVILFASLTFILTRLWLTPTVNAAELHAYPAPEFTQSKPQAWINSPPLQLQDLQGKVTLLNVWTFSCWNCYRSFPWLNKLAQRYAEQDLQVIGIHSPEFPHEHNKDKLLDKVQTFALQYPIMMDNDLSYWEALGNRYWPSFYLIDKSGNIRGRYIGETHHGDHNAVAMEQQIIELLME